MGSPTAECEMCFKTTEVMIESFGKCSGCEKEIKLPLCYACAEHRNDMAQIQKKVWPLFDFKELKPHLSEKMVLQFEQILYYAREAKEPQEITTPTGLKFIAWPSGKLQRQTK